MAGANVRRWGPVSPEPRPTREGQVSTIECSPLEAWHRAMQSSCMVHRSTTRASSPDTEVSSQGASANVAHHHP